MTTVNGMTAEAMIAIRDNVVVGGVVNGSGHLILTKYDASTIDAGSVIGPTGSPGATAAQLNDLLPVNSIIEYNGTTPPNAKWLAMTGQTVTNAQTTYPDWWAVLPAAQKSGANALMPDTRGRVSVGLNTSDTDFDTIAETGGAKTHTLTMAELPASGVSIDPPSTTVSINPPNTAVTINDPGHHHRVMESPGSTSRANQWAQVTAFADYHDGAETFGVNRLENATTGITASVDIAPFNTSVDIAPFNSANLGSGTAHSIVQPYIVFCKMIKVAI